MTDAVAEPVLFNPWKHLGLPPVGAVDPGGLGEVIRFLGAADDERR